MLLLKSASTLYLESTASDIYFKSATQTAMDIMNGNLDVRIYGTSK